MKIGFFDSGIGGIYVMACARKKLPCADFIYYADTDHVPYGLKSREEIVAYSNEAMETLLRYGAEAVVIACNTATSMAAEYLRSRYDVPIIGMEPAVKPAARSHLNENVLVCATPLTITGEKLHTLIEETFAESSSKPTLIGLPMLVTYAEEGLFDTDTVCAYLEKEIIDPRQYAAVVLGCTHFPYFYDSFRAFFGKDVDLLDGTKGTVNRLCTVVSRLGYRESDYEGSVSYIRSGRPVTDEAEIAFFKRLEQVSLTVNHNNK